MIKISDLSVKDHEGKLLLKEIDLDIKRGETTLICGEPGSGKTILLKAIKGLLGDDLSLEGDIESEGKIGMVFQEPEKQVVRRKVKLDVAFELENAGLSVQKMEKRIDRYSSILKTDHLLDRNIDELSHGEITKVALLSTMVSEPDIILLDEPLSPLDRRNQKLVLESIHKLKEQDITVIIAEHDIRDMYHYADKVILLKEGKLKRSGTPKEMYVELVKHGIKVPFEMGLKAHLEGEGI
ncbi:MAG: ABC transporter ATP-binding protein [Candidatus Thermoplasmatota archaeon]|nr:ABC transporter ATP-binding protein [Candidatus Thermoplasmatota archaeon]MBS3789949.1 ABC transporter ATP-binding protein [Candidatus Thermoplasmatota archaeon]